MIPAPNSQVVLNQVAAATRITTVSKSIEQADYGAAYVEGGFYESLQCQANFTQTSELICTLGDPKGHRLMVIYGDSHALMWIPPFEAIAKAEHWRLVVLAKYGCPATRVTIAGSPGFGEPPGPDAACDSWHSWATNWINQHNPSLLVFSQADNIYGPPSHSAPHRCHSRGFNGAVVSTTCSIRSTFPRRRWCFWVPLPNLPSRVQCARPRIRGMSKCAPRLLDHPYRRSTRSIGIRRWLMMLSSSTPFRGSVQERARQSSETTRFTTFWGTTSPVLGLSIFKTSLHRLSLCHCRMLRTSHLT